MIIFLLLYIFAGIAVSYYYTNLYMQCFYDYDMFDIIIIAVSACIIWPIILIIDQINK